MAVSLPSQSSVFLSSRYPGSARVSEFKETIHLACCAAIMLMCLKFASILYWPWARPPFADVTL
ncbi:hypothetical protein BO71DRAFT_398903 [Aspergillus ellipticus CBS 707.79]|uniref:Uncharacterized protein n=1 Tax=Aspergillus ellipticus CBS 707.79 TaxID=1448320 RepID=A0A319DAF6_9EURO|nr:hypothetical protein BO71DRAFT_398903 [Aspergillus ellipticus CBS 707.79]